MPFGLGGFSLSAHHGYNPTSKTLFLGNGQRRGVENEQAVVNTVAGNGLGLTSGDGGPATEAAIGDPRGLAVAPDGTLYIASASNYRIRRVDPDGTVETIAGDGIAGFSGDGGPAVSARINNAHYLALGPDGSLYLSDLTNNRVRRIDPNGIIDTIAGTGSTSYSGDGGPAVLAGIGLPFGIDVGAGGEVYFIGRTNDAKSRVRVIYPDGTIDTLAGGGTSFDAAAIGEDPRAQNFQSGTGLAVSNDGTVYYATDTTASRVYRFAPGGSLESYMGSNFTGVAADGAARETAPLTQPRGLALGADGSLYITVGRVNPGPIGTPARAGVQRVSPDGIVTTVAGSLDVDCFATYCGDGGPATAAQLVTPHELEVGPDGSLYIADSGGARVLRTGSGFPGVAVNDFVFPSEDGSELYVFDAEGRHLETRDALLGNTLVSFDYDAEGLLALVTDIDGLETTFVHDGLDLERIIGPFGHETEVLTDIDGYITSIANPLDEAVTMTYHPGGLIATFADPRGHTSSYTFDARGNLTLAEKPASTGGWQSFDRTSVPEAAPSSRLVTRTTALGRTTRYTIEEHANDDETWTVEGPDGLTAETLIGNDGVNTTTLADGTAGRWERSDRRGRWERSDGGKDRTDGGGPATPSGGRGGGRWER